MKRNFILLLIFLSTCANLTFAQKKIKKVPKAKDEQIKGWIDDYSGFITLSLEQRTAIYELYKDRYLKKDSIHNKVKNDESLSLNEKVQLKKRVDKAIDAKLFDLLSVEDYLNIKCYHQVVTRLVKIEFIAPLSEVQRQRLMMAMREMRFKNVILVNTYGNNSASAKQQMEENRAICSAVEKDIFTEEMYNHLYKLNFLTVVDWSKRNTHSDEEEMSNLLDGYNLLEPTKNLN
ncbi:hypothetical protein [Flammeovirga agarivorans]|uniref:Uncharacterized protein n=1 Tax=Flammeovirga agarivorans TaxID=2726742 RepID=A0A7X8SK45_9BACT|nr:hypothetical protein [Flammeovirga agarivorans]NLR91725.1 hypothetical protein [Flammeovirga agarivorans]